MNLRSMAGICAVVVSAAALATEPRQLTTSPANDTEARYAPDGRSIVFQSDRGGTLDLYTLDSDTGTVAQLTQTPGHACFPAFSPDGQWIVYAYAEFSSTASKGYENGYNLFVMPADGGGEPRRLTSGLVRDYAPEFSPDGRTVYFSSTRIARDLSQIMLYQVPFIGGEPSLVIHRTGHMVQPSISADGRFVAYGAIPGYDATWDIRISRLKQLDDYAVNEADQPRQLWDLATDFSAEHNPNGQWSYGYFTQDRRAAPDTTAAVLFTEAVRTDKMAIDYWHRSDQAPGHHMDLPTIGIAVAGRPDAAVFAPGEITAHPGGFFRGDSPGTTVMARWTAPRAGRIVALGGFKGVAAGDRDFHLLHSATRVLVSHNSTGSSEHPFRTELTVAAGDTIDMSVGRGAALASSTAKLELTIFYADAEEPVVSGAFLPADYNRDATLKADGQESFYAPRWSPSGTTFACTGYRYADNGWNIYRIDAQDGARVCLTKEQPGNSRSPAWSPDGKTIVYENNQTGTYKLYRIGIP
ncbi:MAG: TolB family protein [Lentisphaeria bacterium]